MQQCSNAAMPLDQSFDNVLTVPFSPPGQDNESRMLDFEQEEF